uniref:Uncharacterized protein n=1 Tax=Micrurus lemniscatus lemniscatus TaxID=129467 RepID=A0A2D4JI28_MICLE
MYKLSHANFFLLWLIYVCFFYPTYQAVVNCSAGEIQKLLQSQPLMIKNKAKQLFNLATISHFKSKFAIKRQKFYTSRDIQFYASVQVENKGAFFQKERKIID